MVIAEVEGDDAARRTAWVANALRIGLGKSCSLLAYLRASRMLGWPEDKIEAEGDSLIANAVVQVQSRVRERPAGRDTGGRSNCTESPALSENRNRLDSRMSFISVSYCTFACTASAVASSRCAD
jgi:hypothetical protein